MLFLTVVLVVSKPQYEWVKKGDAPQKERQLKNGLRTALRGLKWQEGTDPSKTAERGMNVGTDPSCHVLSVQWCFSAEPPENGTKSMTFWMETGNIINLAAICSDMIFVRRRFCGNEATLDGL